MVFGGLLRDVVGVGPFLFRRLVCGSKRLLECFERVLNVGENISWIDGWVRRYGLKLSHRREAYIKLANSTTSKLLISLGVRLRGALSCGIGSAHDSGDYGARRYTASSKSDIAMIRLY